MARDPVLGSRVRVHDAALSYNAAPAPKNKVSLQGYSRKVYSISTVYDGYYSIFEFFGVANNPDVLLLVLYGIHSEII